MYVFFHCKSLILNLENAIYSMLIIEARKDNHWTINFQEILVIILRSVGKFYPQNLWITLWIYLLQSLKSQVLQSSVTLYKKATLFYIFIYISYSY